MFFKDIADYKTIVALDANFDFNEIKVHLEDVDRSILLKYLGTDFLVELQAAFATALNVIASVTEPKKSAIIKIRSASAYLALVKWIPIGQVNITQAGIRINSNSENKTAFQWQIKDLEKSMSETGFNALDDLLLFLEQNLADYGTYKDSDEYAENTSLFVSTASEFAKYCSPFKNSCINFLKIRSIIRTVEDFEIQSTILPDYYSDLKTKIAAGETLGAMALKIVEMIKPAVVNLTVARSVSELSATLNADGYLIFDNSGSAGTIESKKQASDQALSRISAAAEKNGKAYLEKLAKYMEANKADYPLFSGDALYVAPADEVKLNPTDPDTTNKYFGGF